MRYFTRVALATLVLLLLAGCGGSQEATNQRQSDGPPTVEGAPRWMTQKPEMQNYMFGAGTGVSPSYQLALDMAESRARQDIGESIEAELRSMTEDFQEQIGGEYMNQFTSTTRTVVDRTLRGTRSRDTQVRKTTEGGYRAFVLMEYPIGPAAEEFIQKLRSNDELYTRFRKSQAFQRMQDAIDRYEENQENAAPSTNQPQ